MGSRNDDIGLFGHTIAPANVNANGTHHRDDLTKLLHIVVFGGLLAHRHQLPKLRLVRKEVGGLDQPLEPVNDERILAPKNVEVLATQVVQVIFKRRVIEFNGAPCTTHGIVKLRRSEEQTSELQSL